MSTDRKYKDYSLGARIRIQIGNIISPYAGKDQIYGSEELRNLLVEVFKFKEYEVSYQLLKILFFGKNKYQNVKLDELINYITEKHMGQNTINNYSLKHNYLCNNDKLMTKNEFVCTVNMALQFMSNRQIQKDQEALNQLFEQIDTNKSGTISQSQYSIFLKEYFGSQSPMAANTFKKVDFKNNDDLLESKTYEEPLSPHKLFDDQLFESKQVLSPVRISRSKSSDSLQEFRDLISSQITAKCLEFDNDNKGSLNRGQTYKFFYDILGLEAHSIDFILMNYFDFVSQKEVGTTELVQVISEVNFREIFSSLLKQQLKIESASKCLLNIELFKKKMLENCYFFSKKPSQSLLQNVFSSLQERSQIKQTGFITLEDFRSYILTSLCNNRLIFRKNPSKKTHTMLMSVPLSIAEVENSHFQEDSECNQMRARQFSSSLCEPYDQQKILNGKGQNNEGNISQLSSRKDIRYSVDENKKEITSQRLLRQSFRTNQQIFKEQSSEQAQLVFSNVPRKRNSLVQPEQSSVKQKLSLNVRKIIKNYTKNSNEQISYQQCLCLFSEEPSMKQLDPSIKNKVLAYVKKHSQINQQLLIKYLIRAVGELSLINYNKSQIKGKFQLSEKEMTTMIFSAFGKIGQLSEENCQTLVAKFIMKNPQKQLNYRTYLQIIDQEFSSSSKK